MPGGSQNCFAMDSCLQVLFQPLDIRELRDLTRTRKKLTEDRTRHKNRIHKTLQDANIKLSTVATDIFGVSGHAMIMALLEKDDLSLEEIKSMTKGKLGKDRSAHQSTGWQGHRPSQIPVEAALRAYRLHLQPDCST